jgi:hypothetical protein
LAHQLAIENEHFTADVVEISEFIDMAQLYRVQGVPKTVVNDRIEIMGAVPESPLSARGAESDRAAAKTVLIRAFSVREA